MPGLNTMLMFAIADLNRRAADAWLSIKDRADGASRVLHISKGNLVGTESSVVRERLGNMLADEGRLDPVLIEPVANEARKRGTLLGFQLITDGLLTTTDLANALERQTRLRFESALACQGTVKIVSKTAPEAVVRLPLGAAVAVAFRSRIPLKPIQDLIAERPKQAIALDLQGEALSRLEVGPSEMRLCRAIASGQTMEQLVASSPTPDNVVRLIGVLVALGLWA